MGGFFFGVSDLELSFHSKYVTHEIDFISELKMMFEDKTDF